MSFDGESSRTTPKAMIGMMLGLGAGLLAAGLLHQNLAFGVGGGMLAGVTCGYCVGGDQPKRSRVALAIFTLALFVVISFLKLQ